MLCVLSTALAGCDQIPSGFVNSLLNPSEVGNYGLLGREGTLDIRSSLTLQDAPIGVMGVSDPQPEDLVPIVEEYEYAVSDSITIRIYELLQRGTETATLGQIDEMGSITLPVLGRMEVAGLTLPEIHAELVDQLVSRGVLVDPEVIVEPGVRRKLSFTIYGTVNNPNVYPLGQYDLRLLDAINLAGGLVDAVTDIYVVRNPELPDPVMVSRTGSRQPVISHSTDGTLNCSGGYPAEASRGIAGALLAQAPTREPAPTTAAAQEELIELMTGEAPPAEQPESAPVEPTQTTPSVPEWVYLNGEWVEAPAKTEKKAAPPAASPAQPKPVAPTERREIMETTTDESVASAPAVAPTTTAEHEAVPPTPSQPRWIYYNGEWIETEAATSAPAQATAPRGTPAPGPATEPAIDWAQVAGLTDNRVIKVSATSLRDGDPRHNIVVRPGDAIRLASGEYGEYYLMGQVGRPGAYSLTGRMITLKTAIAAGGNLGQLAWPQHCTVYRRLGDREQMIQVNLDAIFAGREQDFFLKKDDLILVGTHPVAPFLAVLRNSFRASYGFGFVYDRNFADVDSYGSRPNPVYEQDRFPNLFR